MKKSHDHQDHHDERDERDERVAFGNTDDMKSTSAGSLRHLDDLDDVEIADGEPDIRGWEVKSAEGRKLGEVADLLVDTGAMKVRYVEVKLDEDVAREATRPGDDPNPRSEPLRYVLVPIGTARLDDERDEVLLGSRAEEIAGLPAYRRGELSRDHEHAVLRQGASEEGDRRDEENDAYSGRQFDDSSFFGTRRRGREGASYLRRSADDASGDQQRDQQSDREVRMRPVAEVDVIAVEVEPARGGAGRDDARA